jgi:hypothetical protein
MPDHYTILLKENDTTHLGKVTEKLNEGYYVNNYINVGKSVLLILRKNEEHIELNYERSPVGSISGRI